MLNSRRSSATINVLGVITNEYELVALSDANIARVLQDPPLVWRVIASDDPEAYENARTEGVKPTLLLKLFRRAQPSTTVPAWRCPVLRD